MPNLIEAQLTEMTRTGIDHHDNHVPREFLCYTILCNNVDDTLAIEHGPLYANKGLTDPDTLYLHRAMKAHNWPELRSSMQGIS